MKQLKSSLTDLRELFERAVSARDIAEPLVSFDDRTPGAEVRAVMEQRDYDVVGVRVNGVTSGYVLKSDLGEAMIGSHRRDFQREALIHESEPLIAAFTALRSERFVFVKVLGHAGGIITRGDLQKTPVRLWLFGLVSLLEMQMLRVLRKRHPNDQWVPFLAEGRLAGARRLFDERRRRNEAIDLSDCLQLCDKAAILNDELLGLHCFESKGKLSSFLGEVERLRNALAHSHDILNGRWPELVDLITHLERLLERLELVGAEDRR